MTDCKHYNEKRKNCNALKELYCKTEPTKKCSFYCQKEESPKEAVKDGKA